MEEPKLLQEASRSVEVEAPVEEEQPEAGLTPYVIMRTVVLGHRLVKPRRQDPLSNFQTRGLPGRDMSLWDGPRVAQVRRSDISREHITTQMRISAFMLFGKRSSIRSPITPTVERALLPLRQKSMELPSDFRRPSRLEPVINFKDGVFRALHQSPLILLEICILLTVILRCMLFGFISPIHFKLTI